MAIAKAPSSNDLQSTLARDWAFQVNTGTADDEEWTFVRGLSKFAPNKKPGMKDDSDIDSEGYSSQIATTLEMTFEGEGKRKGKNAAGAFTQDPGQAFLRAKGGQMGFENIVEARCWRTDGVDDGYAGAFSVEWSDEAGGNEDLDEFKFTLMSRGKPERIKPVESADGPSVPWDEDDNGTEPTDPENP